jgi:hypothetical protein
LVLMGAVNLAAAAWAAVDHAAFAERLAPFGPVNGHLLDDDAAVSATFGVARWSALHAVSHIVAGDHPDAGITGPLEAVALVVTTALLVASLIVAERES